MSDSQRNLFRAEALARYARRSHIPEQKVSTPDGVTSVALLWLALSVSLTVGGALLWLATRATT